jgi:hypothetical protein
MNRVEGRNRTDDSRIHDNTAPVQIVRIEVGKETLVIMLALTLVIAACGVVMGLNLARQRTLEDAFLALDRQSRMTELKLDDWTVVAHRAGLQIPGDYTRGPQGNLDAESFHIPQPSKPKGK